MLNRIASAIFLTTVFTAIFSNQITLAQSVNVYFSGTVEPHASFSSYTPGKVESNLSGKDAKSNNKFESVTPAKFNVQTSTPTTISVSSTDITNTNAQGAILRVGSSEISGRTVTLPAGKNTVEIDMSLKPNPVLTPGTYTYDVTVTMVSP